MNQQQPYSPEFIESQKNKITKRLTDLNLKNEERDQSQSFDDEIDPVEASGLVAQQFYNQAEKSTIDKEINDLKSALERINDGSYGLCQTCHGWIEQERLEVVPSATEHMNH